MFIVLKVLKKGSLASFLTHDQGKIVAYYSLSGPFSQLLPGSLVEGDLVESSTHKYPFLRDVRLFSSIVPRGPRAQLFAHVIVDVAYMFLPLGHECTEIFILMHMMVESQLFGSIDTCLIIGPCFLIILLDLLGFYTPPEIKKISLETQLFLNNYVIEQRHLNQGPAGVTLLPSLLLRYDSAQTTLKAWVLECLKEHPLFKKNEVIWMSILRNDMWE